MRTHTYDTLRGLILQTLEFQVMHTFHFSWKAKVAEDFQNALGSQGLPCGEEYVSDKGTAQE